MRDINRIEPFLEELGRLWKEYFPDERFGQMITNIISLVGDVFYMEEDEMLAAIRAYSVGENPKEAVEKIISEKLEKSYIPMSEKEENIMKNMPRINFKGTISDINAVFTIWNEKVEHSSLYYKNSIEELEKQVNVSQIIMEKVNLINRLNKEDIRLLIEKETKEKIRKIKIARIIFDFSEPEDGPCSVDLYLNPGQVFGGFGVHLRLHGDEPRIEMCGLS